MEHLGRDIQLALLQRLNVESVLSVGACCKGWQDAAHDELLWQHLCLRDHPALRWHQEQLRAEGTPWEQAYRSSHRLQGLNCVAWSDERQPDRRPRAREGHAACSWGKRSMLLSSGFGGGVIADLHMLTSLPGGDYVWVQPKVAGRRPVFRYGHSLSRCGANGELAVLFGGLMAGGYQAPLDTLAVLRLRPPPSAAAAAGAAGAATERGEADTSLASRAVDGGGGGWAHVLYANVLLAEAAEAGEEDEDSDHNWMEGDDYDDYSEEDEELEERRQWRGRSEEEEESSDGGRSSEEESSEEESSEAGEAEGASAQDTRKREGAPHPGNSTQVGTPGGTSGLPRGPVQVPAATAPGAPAIESEVSEEGDGCEGAEEEDGGERMADVWAAIEKYEWWYPPVSGDPPDARGYHAAAVSEDGCKLYFFGGIGDSATAPSLSVLDVTTWRYTTLATRGPQPPARIGCSACVYRGGLWVVGGGTGQDLLRSGRDLEDVWRLDLSTLEWRCVEVSGAAPPCAGKCHTSVMVGSRLLLFGGSMHTCSELAWLDLEACAWGQPAVLAGNPPCDRMSATAVLAGSSEVLIYGGYSFNHREMGDVRRLKLLPTQEELEQL
ncbi:hypothetical protein D9Q98_002817 [Chlorella vulgaris]|uniref:F-box domain-containing protein n=1 Tax=Chlorella vulgaris TaxID=3077 RepID=A0A9D4TU69_CHLVU|nr:hypothetical protein D9Q98_002817 [Chlorella vulgaris]